LTGDLPDAQPWTYYVARHEAEGKDAYPIERARLDYRSQPRLKALDASEDFRHWLFTDPIEHFAPGRDALMEKARLNAVPGYALLRLDGTWDEPGEMGWFGLSDATDSSRAMYEGRANAYLEGLAPDVLLVCVDCHI
jgi:hypothetical protein